MSKVWVLDTDTKGTGAQMVPLEKVLEGKSDPPSRPRKPAPRPTRTRGSTGERPQRARFDSQQPKDRLSTPLPPGHVRKKSTGEIGRVQSVDAKAGTASVLWLRQGRTSTVPLTAVSRR